MPDHIDKKTTFKQTTTAMDSIEILKNEIRSIPNFPIEGVDFKDITTLLRNPLTFRLSLDLLADHYRAKHITKVVCIESKGFILGGALADRLGAGFVPMRKPGKLPTETLNQSYELEYGKDTIEIQLDALEEDDNILLHDDVLATGGTARAGLDLLESLNVKNISLGFLAELSFLKGRQKLNTKHEIYSLINY